MVSRGHPWSSGRAPSWDGHPWSLGRGAMVVIAYFMGGGRGLGGSTSSLRAALVPFLPLKWLPPQRAMARIPNRASCGGLES
jgi:hypothetical protein